MVSWGIVAKKKVLCVKYVFHMINKGHMNAALIKKLIRILLWAAHFLHGFISWFPYSPLFKKFENEKISIALFALYIYEIGMWLFSNSLLCPLSSINGTMELSYDYEFTSDFSMDMKE